MKRAISEVNEEMKKGVEVGHIVNTEKANAMVRRRRRRRSDILTINDHDGEVVKEFQIPTNCNQ